MQLTRLAFAANITANPTGQNESQPQLTARYDDSLEYEKCGKPGYAQKDCWDCNGVPPDFRGRGGRSQGRDNGLSRGRGGRACGGHQNTTSELEGSSSQPQSQ